MVIKFQDKQYELISKIKTMGSGNIELYAACDATKREGARYTVACVNDMELARKLVPVTTKNNTAARLKISMTVLMRTADITLSLAMRTADHCSRQWIREIIVCRNVCC